MGDINELSTDLSTALSKVGIGTDQFGADITAAEAGPRSPAVAPTPDDLEAQRARQRELARRYSKTGREGTMLTSDGDKLG